MMSDSTRRAFLEDLDNTHPDHVEKKLLLGEYSAWRESVARGWVEQRKAKKASRQQWIKNVVGCGTFIVAVLAFFLQK
jgi:hypothetical protein